MPGQARHDVGARLTGFYRNPRGSTTPFRTSALGVALALRGFRGGAPRRGGSVRLKEIPDQVGDDMRLERGGRLPPMPLLRTTSSSRR